MFDSINNKIYARYRYRLTCQPLPAGMACPLARHLDYSLRALRCVVDGEP